MRFLLMFFLILPGIAQAEVTVCNENAYDYELAFGFETEGEIVTLGWYALSSQDCSEDLVGAAAFEGYDLNEASKLWLHARDSRLDPDESFGADMELCVDDFFDVFSVNFADSTCAKRGYVRAEFQSVAFVGSGTYTLGPDGFR